MINITPAYSDTGVPSSGKMQGWYILWTVFYDLYFIKCICRSIYWIHEMYGIRNI